MNIDYSLLWLAFDTLTIRFNIAQLQQNNYNTYKFVLNAVLLIKVFAMAYLQELFYNILVMSEMELIGHGAEAKVYKVTKESENFSTVVKERLPKKYRHPDLDKKIN